MLVYVYKSNKKQQTYLYVLQKDNFDDVPKPLMETFGPPSFVMILALQKRQKLAQVDIHKLTTELNSKGFYLQLPPPNEDLLKAHKQSQLKSKG
ncbi:YcgL domain-containing protein [Aliiglaciecola sp. 3_MG-2023]|uniref:YcgL domain-containing protein n=1 Tax=Aliiglaciecola sp. 3_MG-2023 TaxID=3062644 RepID=UPI0026E29297|nr:YcgL domain-containing protein [Aliiglaciecola sp. 3_MG-2023]MDO6694681.1 YcgL domain-containing protein [Aliiglaciecola sp. 3_MG-2023]